MIDCITTVNGAIIPIHNIAIISYHKDTHYIWTNSDGDDSMGHALSEESYNKLISKLNIL